MKLNKAQKIAQGLKELLSLASERIEIAGSIRRLKDEVKDIELVMIVKDYDKLYSLISTVGQVIKPGVPDIVPWEGKPGAKYVRVYLNEEIKVDIFCATPDNWGPLYVMRTGGATDEKGSSFGGFVPGLFQRWKKISGGGKMIGGMPTYPDGTSVICPEEEDFFNLLQMNWVPPQKRVNKKIIKEFVRV